jgi:cytoskeletal protein RodZ
MDEQSQRKPREDEERDRATSNIVLLVGFVVIVGVGIWLANALLDARRADECITQGRRNCTPIETPAR